MEENISREYTTEEVRKEFLNHIWDMIYYWDGLPNMNSRDKLEGLAHSILTAIDGCASLPAFILAPSPHPDDKQYHINNEENYYPQNSEGCAVCDIGGGLHEHFFDLKPKTNH